MELYEKRTKLSLALKRKL